MKNWKDNPENYQRMSEPHANRDAANEALANFYKDAQEARKKHKIADILVVIKDSCVYEDGEVGSFLQHSQYGNKLNGLAMAAYVYGAENAEHKETINKLLTGK